MASSDTASRIQTAGGIFLAMLAGATIFTPRGSLPHPITDAFRLGIMATGSIGLIVCGILQFGSVTRGRRPNDLA